MAKEFQLWADALHEYKANSEAAREAITRKRGELAEARARIQSARAALKVGEESFAIKDRLFTSGAGARADYLAAHQRLLAQKAELDSLEQSLPRLTAVHMRHWPQQPKPTPGRGRGRERGGARNAWNLRPRWPTYPAPWVVGKTGYRGASCCLRQTALSTVSWFPRWAR